jgi:membrane associated rhomboid family serine protease
VELSDICFNAILAIVFGYFVEYRSGTWTSDADFIS